MKTFLSRFGWVWRKENKWWNPDVFSSDPSKSFLLKIERKLLSIIFGRKCSCTIAHGLHPRYFSSHLFFFPPRLCLFFFFFFFLDCLFFFSFFFFNLLGRLVQYSFFFLFFLLLFFFFLFRCDFFYGHDFYFLINLGDWFFFGCLSIFWF